MKSPYSMTGNRKQASIVDAMNEIAKIPIKNGPYQAIIADVYAVDNSKGAPYGVYTLYTIRLAPYGQIIKNVPALTRGGHYTSTRFEEYGKVLPNYGITPSVSRPGDNVQNVEETPYVIDQPVLVEFINGSNFKPVIIGALPCIDGEVGQITADYPKKYGSFQGTSWSIDKTGEVALNIPTTATITIKVGGNILCYLKNGEIDLGSDNSGADLQPTILGDKLKQFLDGVFSSMSGHTHSGVSTGGGVTGPPIGVTVPNDMETSVVKVK